MTISSMIDSAPNPIWWGGATSDTRLATVNRVARLITDRSTGLVRVHRLSNSGVELSSAIYMSIGKTIQLDLSETISAEATVICRNEKRYQLLFDHDVNCATLLRQLVAEARTSHARPLRLDTPCLEAAGESSNGFHRLKIDNISQRGFRMQQDGAFREGLPLHIQLKNGRECRGLVRWTNKHSAGVQLVDLLSVDELGDVGRLSGSAA
jgi:hypothetical protein